MAMVDPERRGAEWALRLTVAAFLFFMLLAGCGWAPVTWGGGGPRSAGGQGTDSELDALRRENRILRQEVELASTGRPYLVLELEKDRVTLKSSGVVLRDFSLLQAAIRIRRPSGLLGGPGPAALESSWGSGTLLPRVVRVRAEILGDTFSPPDPSGGVAFIPPTPEEAVPTPPFFRVRFSDGVGVLVRANPAPRMGLVSDLLHWIRTDPWRLDWLQIELTLPAEDAGALYRSLGDGAPVLVSG